MLTVLVGLVIVWATPQNLTVYCVVHSKISPGLSGQALVNNPSYATKVS